MNPFLISNFQIKKNDPKVLPVSCSEQICTFHKKFKDKSVLTHFKSIKHHAASQKVKFQQS